MTPNILLLTSSSRNFPFDMQETLRSAKLDSTRLASLSDFISTPLRRQPFLAVLEIGNIEDIDRAVLAFEWAESVQPFAAARFLLLIVSKHISLGEKAHRFRGAEIAQLPLPTKNILFKTDLQLKILSNPSLKAPKSEGFLPQSSAVAEKERVLVFKGPGPQEGSWRAGDNSPQGKVRWRWVDKKEAKNTEQTFTWVVESKKVPAFESAEEVWRVTEADADLKCLKGKEEIFSSRDLEKPKTTTESGALPEGKKVGRAHVGAESVKSDQMEPIAPAPATAPATAPAPAREKIPEKTFSQEKKPSTLVTAERDGITGVASLGAAKLQPELEESVSRVEYFFRERNKRKKEAEKKAEQNSDSPEKALTKKLETEESLTTVSTKPFEDLPNSTPPKAAKATGALCEETKSSTSEIENSGPSTTRITSSGQAISSWLEKGAPETVDPALEKSAGEILRARDNQESTETERAKKISSPTPTLENKNRARAATPQMRAPLPETKQKNFESESLPAPKISSPEEGEKISFEPSLKPGKKNRDASREEAEEMATEISAPLAEEEETFVPASPDSNHSEQLAAAESSEIFQTSQEISSARVKEEDRLVLGAGYRNPDANNQTRVVSKTLGEKQEHLTRVGGQWEQKDPEHYLKMRHYLTMTLAELQDKNSTWYPVEGYRIYLSAHHRYYGFSGPEELFPLWIYEGELAPEFLDQKSAWKFYDRLPNVHTSLSTLPAAIMGYLGKIESGGRSGAGASGAGGAGEGGDANPEAEVRESSLARSISQELKNKNPPKRKTWRDSLTRIFRRLLGREKT